MNAPQINNLDADTEFKMQAALAAQKHSYLAEGDVSAETRIDRIDRAINVLVKYSEQISEAMNADFGCRPRQVNLMTDVTGSIECMKHSRKHLKRWMKVEKRPTMFPLNLLGGDQLFSISPKASLACWHPGTSPWGWFSSHWQASWRRATGP